MIQSSIQDARQRASLEDHGFVSILEQLEVYLRTRGYAKSTIGKYEQIALHFTVWLSRRGVVASQVSEHHIVAFLDKHLRKCRCQRHISRSRHTARAAVHKLREVLKENGCFRQDPVAGSLDIEREIELFDYYLRDTCGLRESTRTYRRRYAREFLLAVFRTGPLDVSSLTAKDIAAFVVSRVGDYKPSSAQVLASSIRSYLRYRQFLGDCDESMIAAVTRVPKWTLSRLPVGLSAEQLRRLLKAFDHTSAIGRRDYAMTRCLADLGLRSSEVAGLRLDDIDWRAGTIHIRGGKSRRDDVLPLPATVGRAIVAYLRRGRPETSERAIFIRQRPPAGAAVTTMIVRAAVRYAAARAGMAGMVSGSRTFRHTAATRMLNAGASLKEVADVLRHRDFVTTTIYTKVDLPRLATVAMPWPEDDQ